jgi:hypothetical protein
MNLSFTRVSSGERTPYVRDVIIEPGVYRDRPTGAILLILGMVRLGPVETDPGQNFLDMVDLVVLSPGDIPHEWQTEGARIQCQEDLFDDSRRVDGVIVRGTTLERIV